MCPPESTVRWLLGRGQYKRDEQGGAVIGRGIVVDITESKFNGQAEDRDLLGLPIMEDAPLDRLATCALQARRAVDEIFEHEKPRLRPAVDALLWAVGRALAKRI